MKQSIKMATLAITTLFMGFATQSCSTIKPLEKADLAGYWSLKTLKGEAASDAFKGSIPSLEFDFEKNQVAGSAGCNRYFGGFTLNEDNEFTAGKLGSTMMLCAEDNKEDVFLLSLQNNDEKLALSIEDGVLIFKNKSEVVLQFEKGSAATSGVIKTGEVVKANAENLEGTWKVIIMADEDFSKYFGEKPATITFDKDGAVSGNAGCNTYRTKATINEGSIEFGPLMSTRMACPNLEGEQMFSKFLEKPVQAMFNGDKLMFVQDGKTVLMFEKE